MAVGPFTGKSEEQRAFASVAAVDHDVVNEPIGTDVVAGNGTCDIRRSTRPHLFQRSSFVGLFPEDRANLSEVPAVPSS
jgi:hypothetical protein